MKRIFDIICTSIGLFIFLPFFLVIPVLILLEDGEDYMFYQERIGKNQHPFIVPKFRTMRQGKVTTVGKWLRATGLDELPQLLCIIQGDMSIVGPRPLTSLDINRLHWRHHQTRWDVKPGITGLAQLLAGEGAQASLRADLQYIKHQSIWFDLKIIAFSFIINAIGKSGVRKFIKNNDIFPISNQAV